jgi:hypothetical protein
MSARGDQPRGWTQLVEEDEVDDRTDWPVFARIDWGGAHHQFMSGGIGLRSRRRSW